MTAVADVRSKISAKIGSGMDGISNIIHKATGSPSNIQKVTKAIKADLKLAGAIFEKEHSPEGVRSLTGAIEVFSFLDSGLDVYNCVHSWMNPINAKSIKKTDTCNKLIEALFSACVKQLEANKASQETIKTVLDNFMPIANQNVRPILNELLKNDKKYWTKSQFKQALMNALLKKNIVDSQELAYQALASFEVVRKPKPVIKKFILALFSLSDWISTVITLHKWNVFDLSKISAGMGSGLKAFGGLLTKGATKLKWNAAVRFLDGLPNSKFSNVYAVLTKAANPANIATVINILDSVSTGLAAGGLILSIVEASIRLVDAKKKIKKLTLEIEALKKENLRAKTVWSAAKPDAKPEKNGADAEASSNRMRLAASRKENLPKVILPLEGENPQPANSLPDSHNIVAGPANPESEVAKWLITKPVKTIADLEASLAKAKKEKVRASWDVAAHTFNFTTTTASLVVMVVAPYFPPLAIVGLALPYLGVVSRNFGFFAAMAKPS